MHAKVGPEEENNDLGVDGDDTPIKSLRNQCLFVRTLKIKLSEDVWKRTFPAKSVAIGSFDDQVFPLATKASASSSPSLSSLGSGEFGGGESPPTSFSERSADSDSSISERTSGDEEYNDGPLSPVVSGLAALPILC